VAAHAGAASRRSMPAINALSVKANCTSKSGGADKAGIYRISYWSHSGGQSVMLSGLMALPTDGTSRGSVLYLHGTHTSRRDSISNPTIGEQEGLLVSTAFAGGGYLVAAPDLAGQGISHAPQPYFLRSSTVEQTLDFLHAVQSVSKDLGYAWNANLYLCGFSQGAYNAAAVQHDLEQRNDPALKVRASAGIAGPYDMADIEFPFALTGGSINDSVYLTNLALSYSAFYGRPLESVMTAPMAQSARQLFDGDHSVEDMTNGMPRDPRALFNRDFLDAVDNKRPNWLVDAMRENAVADWAPAAPFRAYYADKDLDAAPQNSVFFVQETIRRGGHAEAIDVGPQDHAGTAFHAVPMIRQWFDELSATAR